MNNTCFFDNNDKNNSTVLTSIIQLYIKTTDIYFYTSPYLLHIHLRYINNIQFINDNNKNIYVQKPNKFCNPKSTLYIDDIFT
ncbi:Hypothetical protein ERGA_CDS_02830 [Ehrlichia ruminantium str. Gardel]|nr:Hypothetical protein ERGA_CDS_02830 [Ehrlichia ruminantium str. Gardel]